MEWEPRENAAGLAAVVHSRAKQWIDMSLNTTIEAANNLERPRKQVDTKTRLDLEKLREAEQKEIARKAELQRLAEEKEAEEAHDRADEDANMQDMGGTDPELL